MSIQETLLLKLGVDTAAWEAGFQRMRDGWKEFGANASEGVKLANEKLTALTEGLDHLNGALELVKKGVEVFKEAGELAHFAAEMRNLQQNVPVERLKMMQEATEGAVDKVTLMRVSMKALTGDFHLTEAGLNVVLKAANTLSDEGFGETIDVFEKLRHSLESGRTRELKELGIQIEESTDKHKLLNEQLEKFKELAEKEVHVDAGLKAIERSRTAWADLVTDVKEKLGNLVDLMEQQAVRLLGVLLTSRQAVDAKATFGYAQKQARAMVPMALPQPGETAPEALQDPENQNQVNAAAAYWIYYAKALAAAQSALVPINAREDLQKDIKSGALMRGLMQGFGPLTVGTPAGSDSGPKGPDDFQQLMQIYKSDLDYNTKWQLGPSALQKGLNDNDNWQLQTSEAPEGPSQFSDIFSEGLQSLQEFSAQRKEFEAQMKDRTSLLGGAFDAMSSGLAASVDAAITGSDSIGRAFMKASAQALKAIALEAGAKALFATAEGLFFANPQALSAAGFYYAAAAAAGIGAAALGAASGAFSSGSSGSPSSAAGGGALSSGSNVANSNQGQNQTFYIVDSFVGRPDELGKALTGKINAATKTGRSKIIPSRPGAVTYKAG